MHRASPEFPPLGNDVPPAPRPAHPLLSGTALCLVAALGYSAVNLFLRELAVRHDPLTILCAKETVTVLPLLAWLALRRTTAPQARASRAKLLSLVGVGLLTNVLATPTLLWAMGVVGIAIAVPVSLGMNLVAAAAFGRMFLKERISGQSAAAISLLIAAVCLLSMGAGQANESIAEEALALGPWWVLLAVVVSCQAGIIYGMLNVTIRRTVTDGVRPETIAAIVPLMGSLPLLPICLWRHGLDGLLATDPRDCLILLAAGVLNLTAFLAIIKGLQVTTLVHANVLTASQAALAALGGLFFFREAASPALMVGVSLTVAGMFLINRPAA